MTNKEWTAYIATKNDGKDMVWNNYWTKIDDKREYKGEFKKDNKSEYEGLGYIKFLDGSMYSGFVQNKLRNGKGRMTYANGDIYQGEWLNGKAHGNGVFVDKEDQTIYEGAWEADKQHGQGVETWNNGLSQYKGEFVQGKKTGWARYEQDGNVYEGDFVDGKFHGKGKYYFVETGKTYEGDFQNNQMNGKGKMIWPDQSRYEGDFKNGKAEGNGVEYLSNGDKYTGQFSKDQKHGAGIYYNAADQTKRQGEWQNGKRITWLSQPQSTHIGGGDQVGMKSGNSPSRLWQGGRWKNDFKDKLNTKYKLPTY